MSVSKKIPAYVRDFEYSSLKDYFEALIDGEGEYRMSGISPDLVYMISAEFFETRFSNRETYSYSDLGYDMWGKPGRIVISIRKNRCHGSFNIKTEWTPIFPGMC